MEIKLEQPWHENQSKRESIGFMAEAIFQNSWACSCGGSFVSMYVGKKPGTPDFQCDQCGALVEVKSNTKKRKCDNVSISSIPFDNYPLETILAYHDHDGEWIGVIRRDAVVYSGPHEPAHSTKGTSYYWVSLDNFVPLDNFGLQRKVET